MDSTKRTEYAFALRAAGYADGSADGRALHRFYRTAVMDFTFGFYDSHCEEHKAQERLEK